MQACLLQLVCRQNKNFAAGKESIHANCVDGSSNICNRLVTLYLLLSVLYLEWIIPIIGSITAKNPIHNTILVHKTKFLIQYPLNS
jgi:hypothetical protein